MITTTVYDKAFVRVGFINDPTEVVITPRHNDVGTAKLTLPLDHPKAAMLLEPGVRAVFEEDGEFRLSGPVRAIDAEGPSTEGTITFTFDSDFRELKNILGWPVPGAAITAQGTAEFYTITGPAETVVKDLVTKNGVTRLGKPITVAPNLGRGGTITVAARFEPLYDKLVPVLDGAGIGVTIKQSGAGLVLDCYTPSTYPLELTEESGIITNFSWSYTPPTATDVVVGGQGDGIDRTFLKFQDTARTAEQGERIEVFKDATDADTPELFQERANETLAENAGLPGVKVEMSETSNFRYGGDRFNVGDKVRVRIGPGLVVEDILREATITWTHDDGKTTVPAIGETKTPEQKLAGGLKNLARGLRELRSR
jgi:hypothetical protein